VAADTAAKRYSAINIASPWRGLNVVPAAIDQGQRQAVMFMYSGILAGAAVTPPVTPPSTGSAGGGRYRYYTPIPYEDCRREIKQARAEKKRVEKQIARVKREIEDKRRSADYEFNMVRLNRLIAELAKLQDKLEALLRMLDEIEEEIEICLAAVADE